MSNKRKIRWTASASPDVTGYRVYWNLDGPINVTTSPSRLFPAAQLQAVIPDDIPELGGVEDDTVNVGVASIDDVGNESDVTEIVASFAPRISGRLVNVSVRGLTAKAAGGLIVGLVVTGAPATVLLRAVGPTIGAPPFNVPGTLVDPKVWIKNGAGVTIASNDNWSGAGVSEAAARVGAFALPVGSKDAALLITLTPGLYTAHVSGPVGDEEGIVLLEAYEVPPP